MKVLYLHQHFSTPSGATGLRSYEMARALLQSGHEVMMVCGSYAGGTSGLNGPFVRGRREGLVDGIRVVEFALPYSNTDGFLKRTDLFLIFAVRSIALALRENYDIVFATTTPLTAGIPGIFARWIRSKPFVFEVRDLWPELPKAMGVIRNPVALGLMSMLESVTYRSACRLIGLSPGIVDGIARHGIPRRAITMIPNGCNFDIFSQSGAPWQPDGVKDGDLLAVFAGTHGIANGLESVLDAAAELGRRGRTDIKFLLIGQGRLKPALMTRAKAERLDNVMFCAPVDKARLAGLMARADIGMQILANVSAFYYGTSPNKFFDYLASGTPVLTNYPGWLAEMIRENHCGYAVPAADPVAFADALEHAADNREQLVAMGRRAEQLGRRTFDRTQLASQFVDWLEGAAAT